VVTIRRRSIVLALGATLAVALAACIAGAASAAPNAPDPATGFLLNGRQLTPQGAQVDLGKLPHGRRGHG
jgi:hypothetical protein